MSTATPAERFLARAPVARLRPWIERLWIADRGVACRSHGERVLPTGGMHLAFSLSGEPFRIVAADGCLIEAPSLVGGARSGFYERLPGAPRRTAGVQLRAGACEALLGVPADTLAEAHTPLDALWGTAATTVLDRVAEAREPAAALAALEAALAERLPRVHGMHPAVAHALARFVLSPQVGDVVRETGLSHRRFVALFRRSVGLGPKRWCRVQRFARALRCMDADLAAAALAAGYADQAHFAREFRELAGMTPGEYRRLTPRRPHHVPVAAAR
jgi:AraC-like DNA-binding protein